MADERADLPPPLARGAYVEPGLCVVAHLSRGRRCDVYRVVDEEAGSAPRIAKIAHRAREGSNDAVTHLRAELDLLARFDHDSIVRPVRALERGALIEDVGGETLRRHLSGGRRSSWREVARIGSELASALDAVHDAGFVHCDVKPENIVVGTYRYVLIDFDLARPPGRVAAGIGTRQYLAPEQARGGLVGPPADAWGLALVLYRAAAGSLPFPEVGDTSGGERYPQLRLRTPPLDTVRLGGGDVSLLIDALLDPLPAHRPVLGWAASMLEDAYRALGRVDA